MSLVVTGYLADHEDSPSGVALHGTVAATALSAAIADKTLCVGPYQRERRSNQKLMKLVNAVRDKMVLPPVALGMRGEKFTSEPDTEVYDLLDPIYIVDGLQRAAAAMAYGAKSDVPIFLPCVVYFNTTEEWERRYFKVWNTERNDPSPSLHLRNAKEEHPMIASLYGLTRTDPKFCLYNKVCWDQDMKSHELLRATVLVKTVLYLHGATTTRGKVDIMIAGLDKLSGERGIQSVRENVQEFFDVVDYCWDIKSKTRKDHPLVMRESFLLALASVFSADAFWYKRRFSVPYDVKRKLFTLKLSGELERLARAGHGDVQVMSYLSDMILRHINSGKRTRRVEAVL